MFRDAATQYQQDERTLQAFTSLLTLVEALASITDQAENATCSETESVPVPPITLATAGQSFAEITNRALNCTYVAVFALDPPDERQRLLGIDGLSPQEIKQLQSDTDQTPLANYVDAEALAQLHANQIITIDLKERPFVTTRSTHGARYRLVAPLMLHGGLIGLFTMAKTDDTYPDVQSAYSPAEIALTKGIARLAAQVIEKVSLLQEKAEAKANEQRLQESTRRYEDFLSTASHELRTPLTTIKGNVQLAQRRVLALEKEADQNSLPIDKLQRIEYPLKETLLNFDRLERMIRELLDFSRIQADKFVMQKRPCNLVEIVIRAVQEVRQTTSAYGYGRTIFLSLPAEEVVPIIADADRISEVLSNYLSNAHKYSPVERPIMVSLTVEGLLARVAVRDKGPGISPTDQEHIWERFYRAPGIETPEQSSANSNLGLGLYICKEIIELHQGCVGVESVPGHGATFWFTLELANSACGQESAQ